jgi:hypothetical protein
MKVMEFFQNLTKTHETALRRQGSQVRILSGAPFKTLIYMCKYRLIDCYTARYFLLVGTGWAKSSKTAQISGKVVTSVNRIGNVARFDTRLFICAIFQCEFPYCFKFASALSFPSIVFGPVLKPPCSLHRPFANAFMRHGFPVLLAKAPHRWRNRLLRLIRLEAAFSASGLSSIRS